MIKRLPGFAWLSSGRIAIGLVIALALANLTMLGISLSNRARAAALGESAQEIDSTLGQLQQAEAQGLQSLEADLANAMKELEGLKASFPEIGAGFNLYSRGFELAEQAGVRVKSIQREGTSSQPTVAGQFQLTSYALRSSAPLDACLAYISSLEGEGLDTLALSNVQMNPESLQCDFSVDIASTGGVE